MTGKRSFRGVLPAHWLRKGRFAVACALLLSVGLQCFDLHAELLFRSAEKVNGQQAWSPVRKYSNPLDTDYGRVSARGTAMPAEEVRVFLTGEITRADVESAAVMATLLKTGKQSIAGNTVWLASNGGDIDAGMALGRLLRKSGLFTFVARNDQCFSACVFAFMGGERRGVAGRLGIHRPYFSFTDDAPDRQARFRYMQRVLKDYVEDMDFPPSLYEAVMAVPPEHIRILASADLKRFYLEGISPASEDAADAAAARRLGLPMFDYLQRKARSPACAFPVADAGRCEDKALEVTASGVAAETQSNVQKGEAVSPVQPVGQAKGYTKGYLPGAGIRRSSTGPER